MGVSESLNSLTIGIKETIDIILILAVLGLVIVILKVIEKEYEIKLELRRKDRNLFYKKELNKIKGMERSPEKILERIHIVARGFFKEAFNFPYNLEYLELAENFERLGKKECVIFCQLVSELAYSGEKIDEDNVNNLIKLLDKIMEDNQIISEEERARLKKGKTPITTEAKGQEVTSEKSHIPNNASNAKEKETSDITEKIIPRPVDAKRRDINYIGWKYKLKIIILRLRGRLPEIRKTRLGN
jgi:hypothetical protein